MIFPSVVYVSFLRGCSKLADYDKEYELIGSVLSVILSGYELKQDELIYELCFIGLYLQHFGLIQQSDGLLWQIATEWPIQDMVGWRKLWQAALLGEKYSIFSDDSEIALRIKLNLAKTRAENVFTKDGAHFYKLSSLRSVRHMTMMDRLLQSMFEILVKLKKYEIELEKANSEKLPGIISKIAKKIKDDIQDQLSDLNLADMYDNGIREDKIIDSNPFYQRTSYGILYECANSLIEYSQFILDYWNLILQRMDGVDCNILRAELELIPNISEEGKKAALCVIQANETEKHPKEEVINVNQLNQLIVYGLLNKTGLSLILPRVLGHIIETELEWSTVLTFLLQDIGSYQEPSEIASYLLEHKAPDHVLSIVQHIPLDFQNQAQSLRSEYEHRCDRLFLDILQLGGKTDDLSKARELGRWGWLFSELNRRAEILRFKAENERQEIEKQIRQYRKTIQDLDDQIFELQS